MENHIEFLRNVYNPKSSETLLKIIEESEYLRHGLYHICDLFNILFEAFEIRLYLANIYMEVFKVIVDRFHIKFIQAKNVNKIFEPLLDISDNCQQIFIQYTTNANVLIDYLEKGCLNLCKNETEEIIFRDDLEAFLKRSQSIIIEEALTTAIEYNAEKILEHLLKTIKNFSRIDIITALKVGNMKFLRKLSETLDCSKFEDFSFEGYACCSHSIEVIEWFNKNIDYIPSYEFYHSQYLEPFVKTEYTFHPLSVALNTCSTEVFKEMIEKMSKKDIEILTKIMFSRYEFDDGLVISRWSHCYLSAYMNEYIRKYLEKHFKGLLTNVIEKCH